MKYPSKNVLLRYAIGNKKDHFSYYAVAVAIVVGIFLSFTSHLKLCTEACNGVHNYRLFGFAFETIGFVFFPCLLVIHLLSKIYPFLRLLAGWMLCAAIGAELMFIYVQKYVIGSWCLVCLWIATVMFFAGLVYFYEFCTNCKQALQQNRQGSRMNSISKTFSGLTFLVFGFLFSLFGIANEHSLEANENTIKEHVAFGNQNSVIDIYLFTDWECPACRSLEPTIEQMMPSLMKNNRVTFVDFPVHEASLNFTPYNLSFMIKNKPNYLKLRNKLTKLSAETKEPKDQQVETLAKEANTSYEHLNYSDVTEGTQYFDHLVKTYKVEGTPTLVIVNNKTKKHKTLEGKGEITEAQINKTIKSLQ